MDELDLIDELELLEHHGAGQAVKITAGNKASCLLFHIRTSVGK
jgi:hypothetical protein